jgi:hypothetical protein
MPLRRVRQHDAYKARPTKLPIFALTNRSLMVGLIHLSFAIMSIFIEQPEVGQWWKIVNTAIDQNRTIPGVLPARSLNFAGRGPSIAHPFLITYINVRDSGPIAKVVPRTTHPNGRPGWEHARHQNCLPKCVLDASATVCRNECSVLLEDFQDDTKSFYSCTESVSSHIIRELNNLGIIEL